MPSGSLPLTHEQRERAMWNLCHAIDEARERERLEKLARRLHYTEPLQPADYQGLRQIDHLRALGVTITLPDIRKQIEIARAWAARVAPQMESVK